MSSPRSNYLPVGYSLRSANPADSIEIFYLELIDNYYLTDRIIELLLICTVLIAAWIIAIVHTSSVWTFFFVFSPFSVVCCLAFLDHLKYINDIKNERLSVWFIEHKNTVCGYMVCKKLTEYTLVHRLLVVKADRGQGIGRFLINHCIDTVRKPIYVISPSERRTFYYLYGFVDVDFSNIPNELYRLRDRNGIQLMVFQPSN
jgi:GNAT superfamily N-acetyltransferase